MSEIEGERRLPGHAERAGIDHQIETSLAVIEGKIGGGGKMRQVNRMMLAIWVDLVQQRGQTQVELFNLAKDPAETTDLASQNAAQVAALSRLYDTWLDQMAEPMDGVGKRPTNSSGSTKKEKKKKRAEK